jgi:hypothetical protein
LQQRRHESCDKAQKCRGDATMVAAGGAMNW